MTAAFAQFELNIAQASDLVGLANAVGAATTDALDTSDLLRSSLVATVSALDYSVHQVVRELMIETALGYRNATDAFGRFAVSTAAALRAANGVSPRDWMNQEIQAQHGHLAFQQPDKIADAIRLVWDQPLWQTVAAQLGKTSDSLRQELRLVVSRRNQIAHEADRDPTPPHDRWPIRSNDVDSAIQLISGIVMALEAVL
jgi:hypothetical protein